jgi:hypothetical protein
MLSLSKHRFLFRVPQEERHFGRLSANGSEMGFLN